MHTTNLRKVGGSVMLPVPPAFLDQLHLQAGATVGVAVADGHHPLRVVDRCPLEFHGKPAVREPVATTRQAARTYRVL